MLPFQAFIDTLDERALLLGDKPLPAAAYEPIARYCGARKAAVAARRAAWWQAHQDELSS